MTKGKALNAPLYKLIQLVWLLFGILEVLLVLRFLLRLIGANPGVSFTDFIYDLSAFFLAPFAFIVSPTVIDGLVFEWHTLIALLAYWILGWIIVRSIALAKPVSAEEAERGIERETN